MSIDSIRTLVEKIDSKLQVERTNEGLIRVTAGKLATNPDHFRSLKSVASALKRQGIEHIVTPIGEINIDPRQLNEGVDVEEIAANALIDAAYALGDKAATDFLATQSNASPEQTKAFLQGAAKKFGQRITINKDRFSGMGTRDV